jgi:hypothetical protein
MMMTTCLNEILYTIDSGQFGLLCICLAVEGHFTYWIYEEKVQLLAAEGSDQKLPGGIY